MICSSFVIVFSSRAYRWLFLCLQASAPLILLPTKIFMHEYEQYSLLYEFRESVNWRHYRLREFCLFAVKKFPLLWSSGTIYWFVGSHLRCIKIQLQYGYGTRSSVLLVCETVYCKTKIMEGGFLWCVIDLPGLWTARLLLQYLIQTDSDMEKINMCSGLVRKMS